MIHGGAQILISIVAALSFAFGGERLLLPRREPLTICASQLAPTVAEDDFRRGILRRLGQWHVTDAADFSRHDFTTSDDPTTHLDDPPQFALPELIFTEARWRRERWQITPGGAPYYFVDVGFRNLFEDAQTTNALVSGVLLSTNHSHVRFNASPARVRDLGRLSTFRWACYQRVMNVYRQTKTKQKYLGDLDYQSFLRADRANLNVDVLAVLGRPLDWCAPEDEVKAAVGATIQISYEEPFGDLLRPSLDGLLAANNEAPTGTPRLPFVERLNPERRDEFVKRLNLDYVGLRKCEMTRYINRRVSSAAMDRLSVETLIRALERGCDVIFASLDQFTLRKFRRYGFDFDRILPTLGTAEESLAVLRVGSPAFNEALARLERETRAMDITPY